MGKSVLIFFDNVDNCEIDFETFDDYCENYHFHKIITTRLKGCFDKYEPIEVLPLSPEEQMELFEQTTQMDIDASEKAALGEVFEKIDGHTKFIIILAGIYLEGNKEEFEKVIDCLRSATVDKSNKVGKLLQAIYHTINLSDDERAVLYSLFVLPEEGVSQRLIRNHLLPNGGLKQIGTLVKKSWIEAENKIRVYLHPVIRDMLIAEENIMSFEQHKKLFEACYRAVADKDTGVEYKNELCHSAVSLVENIDFSGHLDEDVVGKILAMASFCNQNYKFDFARDICCKVTNFELAEITNQTKTELYTVLGKAYQRLADYTNAKKCYKEAIRNAEAGENRDVSKTKLGKCYRNLGEVCRKASEYDEALENDEKALKYLSDPLDIAEAENAIGVVYINQGNYPKAIEYYLKALKKRKENGTSKKDLAYSYHNIGTVYNKQGEYEKAAEYHEKALVIRRENNIDDSDIAASLAFLGNDYTMLGEMEKAKALIEESLEIRKKLYGEMHPDYAWGLDNLRIWYKKTGNIEAAKELLAKVAFRAK